jgi:hypothetical protein
VADFGTSSNTKTLALKHQQIDDFFSLYDFLRLVVDLRSPKHAFLDFYLTYVGLKTS